MVNPILAGSIALMVSTGAGLWLAPRADALLDARVDACEGASASAHADARTRHAHAQKRAHARVAQWSCDDDAREEDDRDEREEDACEEHGKAHRRHARDHLRAEAGVRVRASVSAGASA